MTNADTADADTDTEITEITEITGRYDTLSETARGSDGVTHCRFQEHAINTSQQRR